MEVQWDDVNPTDEELEQKLVRPWKHHVTNAIRLVENRHRKEDGLEPLNPRHRILFAGNNPAAHLTLLNFRTWTLRYGVTIEFIIEALRRAWPKRYRLIHRGGFYILTLLPQRLITDTDRRHVEEAVLEAYPNGEQWSAQSLVNIPRIAADPNDPRYIRLYARAIHRARREEEKRQERRRSLRRNFRRPELEWPPKDK